MAMIMKSRIGILLLVVLCLVSCSKKKGTARISGTIKGLTTDVMYMYGQDGTYDEVDTIKVKDGHFDCRVPADTLSAVFLLINEESEYPIYFDKGDHIRIKGNANHLSVLKVSGNDANDDFADFRKSLAKTGNLLKLTFNGDTNNDRELMRQAEDFISKNPKSPVSIYLLDRFFVHQLMPDYPRIKRIIGTLDKSLRNSAHVNQINDFVNRWNNSRMGAVAPNFTLSDGKGGYVSRTSSEFQNKYILLAFWASWASNRAQTATEMNSLYRAFRGNPRFEMVGVSLDTDKGEWMRAVRQDSLQSRQLCDFYGFNSPVVSTYTVSSLPSYYLIAPDGVILARDMTGDALKRQISAALK
jgi:peroxiredoxin